MMEEVDVKECDEGGQGEIGVRLMEIRKSRHQILDYSIRNPSCPGCDKM